MKGLSKPLFQIFLLGCGLGIGVAVIQGSLSEGAAVGGALATLTFALMTGWAFSANLRFSLTQKKRFEGAAVALCAFCAGLSLLVSLGLIALDGEASDIAAAPVWAAAVVGILTGLVAGVVSG